jgi:riboflavin synthase
MFTGIITGIGQIVAATPLGAGQAYGKRLRVTTPAGFLGDVALGDSIALNGACMTVVAFDARADWFEIDISVESLARTAGLQDARTVNLELALRASDRVGGHWVSGHVDGIGQVERFEAVGESWRLALALPRGMAPFMAAKGSIVVQGVSLTINAVSDRPDDCQVEINLVPHTLQRTTLGGLRVGDSVNIEVDLIARYVERALSARMAGS